MKWFEKPEVLDYIVSAYQGTDAGKRQFVWEDEAGDVVIGNARAFTDHVSRKFELGLESTSWSGLHEVMRMLGEVVHPYSPRVRTKGGKFKNQEPEVRVLSRTRSSRSGS